MQNALHRQLDTLVARAMQEKQIPGLAIAVTHDGATVYAKAFGVTNLQTATPVTLETLFHLASVTKLFVATAALQLVEQGRVDLHAPVVKYLPYFQLADPRFSQITVAQMLTHTAGMPDTDDYGWEQPEYDDEALERYVRSLHSLALIADPGERFAYSNIAFEVLGDLVAKTSGISFEQFVREHILLPLGLQRSTLLVRDADPDLLATPHVQNEAGNMIVSEVFPYNRAHAPSSTLYSNVVELSRWAVAQLNRGELDGVRILPEHYYSQMWQPQAETGWSSGTKIGLTWFLWERQGHQLVGHDGEDVGFSSSLVLVPDQQLSVVILCNCDSALPEDLADEVVDMLLAAG